MSDTIQTEATTLQKVECEACNHMRYTITKFTLREDNWRYFEDVGWLCPDHNVRCAWCSEASTPRLDPHLLYAAKWRILRGKWACPGCALNVPTLAQIWRRNE
jgi:hypothetical protein